MKKLILLAIVLSATVALGLPATHQSTAINLTGIKTDGSKTFSVPSQARGSWFCEAVQ